MQRTINDPDIVGEDMLAGFVKAHANIVVPTKNPRVVKYAKAPVHGKVGVVTGGGSGHKPAFIAYVSRNLVDAVAVGEIFSSPTAAAFLEASREADSGKRGACLYGNYAGDNMNVKMAIEMAAEGGIEVKTVVANDDVPSAPESEREKQRGAAGEVLMGRLAEMRLASAFRSPAADVWESSPTSVRSRSTQPVSTNQLQSFGRDMLGRFGDGLQGVVEGAHSL